MYRWTEVGVPRCTDQFLFFFFLYIIYLPQIRHAAAVDQVSEVTMEDAHRPGDASGETLVGQRQACWYSRFCLRERCLYRLCPKKTTWRSIFATSFVVFARDSQPGSALLVSTGISSRLPVHRPLRPNFPSNETD